MLIWQVGCAALPCTTWNSQLLMASWPAAGLPAQRDNVQQPDQRMREGRGVAPGAAAAGGDAAGRVQPQRDQLQLPDHGLRTRSAGLKSGLLADVWGVHAFMACTLRRVSRAEQVAHEHHAQHEQECWLDTNGDHQESTVHFLRH